jgi:alkylation response protein AidB-like acyl-CoA dehydrogenase
MSEAQTDPDTFAAEVRAWLEENCPASMRSPLKSDDEICWGGRKFNYISQDQKDWLDRMAAKGWTVPTWPREYGGAGLSKQEERVLRKEMKKLGCRVPLTSLGIIMLAPALMKFGTEEQKLEHLPKIARGEIRWCQGYSEPGAGSDLASLKTSAEDHGDHWIVNGSKIWTSYANHADWIFCLVRTDPGAPKREGISFVLFDMETEGVSTSPIKLISGASPFCQTFFDNVRVEKKNLIGELNKGWTVAKYLLQHERETIGLSASSGADGRKKKTLEQSAKEVYGEEGNRIADPVIRQKIARFQIKEQAFGMTLARMGEEAKSGHIGTASSIFKYYGSELNKERRELMLTVNGMDSLGWEGSEFNNGEVARSWLRSKANSIEGGSSEIQMNIIAKRVLGLPGVIS